MKVNRTQHASPREHWTSIYSTNQLKRTNKEIKRRTDVVGIFPNEGSVERPESSILMELDGE
jgi:transposase-like protein